MEVELFGSLQRAAGRSHLSLEAPTVRRLLDALAAACGEGMRRELFQPDGNLRAGLAVLVNGRNIAFLEGLATPLGPGDRVTLIPPAGGG